METEDEIFELWIEKGSRVHAERDFVAEHYSAVLSRVEALIGLPKNRETFLNEDTLQDYFTVRPTEIFSFPPFLERRIWRERCFDQIL